MALTQAPTAPTAAPAKATHLSREQVTKAHEELRRTLVAGSDSDAALSYASTLATFAANARRYHGTFKRWSNNNLLLLEAQRRRRNLHHVGLYAGNLQWEKMERSVRDDAVPLTIWVFTGRDDDPNTAALASPPNAGPQSAKTAKTTKAAAPQVRHGFGFIPRYVYDYTDTVSTVEGFVEPNWAVPLAAGDRATLDHLVASSPTPVTFADFGAKLENGVLDGHGIRVHSEAPLGNQISTLAHELAHFHLGHLAVLEDAKRSERNQVRAGIEAEAALTQWLVMKMLGLDETVGNDVTVAAADYLRSWVDPDTGEEVAGHKKREKILASRIDVALTAAETIVDAYLAATPAA